MFGTLDLNVGPGQKLLYGWSNRETKKANINIFTFRWYLVFLKFLIRGLRGSEHDTFTAGDMFGTLDLNVGPGQKLLFGWSNKETKKNKY